MAVVDRARVGAALPGYTLGAELGAGAFGLVLGAHHQDLDRQVAVKVLVNTAPQAVAEFRAEARLLARLDHPHIVRTYDYVARGDLCLLVMELLAGPTLARRRPRPEASCAIVLALADALAHAHAHGVLHRDIKPANVLFTETGQPKLADFGISKIVEGSASTASRVVGTPRYMAPEQITGGRLSPATDLYALAAVLYELLSGSPLVPRRVPLPVLLYHHLEVVPPPPPGVPEPLADVVTRSLAKRPEDRHPDARAFAADLARAATKVFGRGWLDRSGIPARISEDVRALTTSRLARLGGPDGTGDGRRGRRPLAWAGVGATAALLAGTLAVGGAVGGGISWAAWGERPEPTPTPTTPPPAWQPTTLQLGMITRVFAADEGYAGDDGPVDLASFDLLSGFELDPKRGHLYIADTYNERVRRVDRNGIVTTVAGNGVKGFAGDAGPATKAQLSWPWDVAVADDGTLYIVDIENNRVRRIDTRGVITTVAGTGDAGGNYNGPVGEDGLTFSGDGVPATQAHLNEPNSVVFDGYGNLYLADGFHNRIRRIDTKGVITTVAGTGVEGFAGDGGPATRAFLDYPSDLTIGPDGSLYFIDEGNVRIRRVTPQGVITTIAGNGSREYSGDDGPATTAGLGSSGTIEIDAAGTIYLAGESRIRRIDTQGMITTIAGTGESGDSGDGGPAKEAEIGFVVGLALDDQGILYVLTSDGRLRAIRVAEPPCLAPPCPSPTASRPAASPTGSPRPPASPSGTPLPSMTSPPVTSPPETTAEPPATAPVATGS
ncbi:protein kinase [Frankia sp. CNm7]|uniref:Protein kinase n=1 Tax=Frankia nepalensis TaxID=1836974 RepID=A0A937URL1_9ACTN|nr:protein kinase [Frankia nepalensis]MBL7500465.1 protein kinase [Frankia nepalensis]MBL7512817.1 protein kinase [Frankia nepalensis]MBL7522536.1 protein kinase [Frankia nepalensis]MBL7631243.1 protein kinase [Frankia nepalensis]